ncbi:MAG: hypothetical protein IJU91_07400 [Selenomonadaceae bacterium]|nr:hypothetical protein [Selenomonadaceae bacterium]
MKINNLAQDWRKMFKSLSASELEEAKKIIALNKFSDADILQAESETVRQFLKFYQITRDQ